MEFLIGFFWDFHGDLMGFDGISLIFWVPRAAIWGLGHIVSCGTARLGNRWSTTENHGFEAKWGIHQHQSTKTEIMLDRFLAQLAGWIV